LFCANIIEALRLQSGLATGFVRVNAHRPATGLPARRVPGFPFSMFCLCGSERRACAHGLVPEREQLKFDWKIVAAGGLLASNALADTVTLVNGDRLKLFQASDLQLSLESLENYLYQSRTGGRLPMGNGLSFGTQVNFDYDAVPAAGKDTTDTDLIFKLSYAL